VALDTQLYMDALISHALSSGHFVSVNAVDVGSTPTNEGLTAVLWPRRITPAPGRSGLASTSVVMTFVMRLFHSSVSDPLGQIDPIMLNATDALLNAFSGDFTLGGIVAEVDLLGQYGEQLRSDSGWLDMGGGADESKKFRIVDITIPLIINDIWTQAP
jgi:hypothetical protein